jgi:hypothetical protein
MFSPEMVIMIYINIYKYTYLHISTYMYVFTYTFVYKHICTYTCIKLHKSTGILESTSYFSRFLIHIYPYTHIYVYFTCT